MGNYDKNEKFHPLIPIPTTPEEHKTYLEMTQESRIKDEEFVNKSYSHEIVGQLEDIIKSCGIDYTHPVLEIWNKHCIVYFKGNRVPQASGGQAHVINIRNFIDARIDARETNGLKEFLNKINLIKYCVNKLGGGDFINDDWFEKIEELIKLKQNSNTGIKSKPGIENKTFSYADVIYQKEIEYCISKPGIVKKALMYKKDKKQFQRDLHLCKFIKYPILEIRNRQTERSIGMLAIKKSQEKFNDVNRLIDKILKITEKERSSKSDKKRPNVTQSDNKSY